MKNNNSNSQQNKNHNMSNQNTGNSGEQQQQRQQQQQQQQQQQHHQHDKRRPYTNTNHLPFKGQRDRSGQRGQFPDSSMGRDYSNRQQGGQPNYGAVKFTPGEPTRELPAIETRTDPHKKFSGRCRLFVANLAHNTTEEKLRALFERFGEIGEVFISPKQNTYAFIKLDTRQNAEAAREALDCTTLDGRVLRVRLAAHPAAIRVKHLSSEVTDELLAYSFRFFGEVERAVVILNKKGKSTGEGIVEFVNRQSAAYALKKCESDCFMLTSSLQPVLVEKYDPLDEDEGYPEAGINKNSIEFKEQREIGPRFAAQGTFEHDFGLKWKQLYIVEQAKREQLENDIQAGRKQLQDQIKYLKIEHDTVALKNRLQQLEDTRLELLQYKEQTVSTAQHQDEIRRQQDLMLRQREDDILRRQQLGDPQQGASMRRQDMTSNREHSNISDNQPEQSSMQPKVNGPELDSGLSPPIHFAAAPVANQPVSYTDATMMNLSQQPFMQLHPQMVIPPPTQNSTMNHPSMFAPYLQQQTMDATATPTFVPHPGFQVVPQQQIPQQSYPSGQFRPKFRRDFQNQGNNTTSPSDGGHRARKRSKY